jgi:tetratricopeptide (TPR) repeat protein
MKLRVLIMICLVLGIAASRETSAFAQDESLNRAQEAFDKAQAAYEAGRYDEAIEQFEVAYAARPFPQFLYNLGATQYMKGRSTNDPDAYQKCVDYYKRYLGEDPQSPDRKTLEDTIKILEKEIERLRANPNPVTPPPPSEDVAKLGEAKIRGLVVIESDPANANIYVDSKAAGPMGKTPWSGGLEGEHTVFVERQGYKPMEKRFTPDPDKLLVIYFGMSEEDYLGWIEVKSNIPGAEIYFDDKSVGIAGRTPFSGNVKPGKKKVWITAEGYDEHYEEIEIIPGKTHEVTATLKGSPVGYLNMRGPGIEYAAIYMDGELLCERGPCRKAVKEGEHTISVRRAGYKPYNRKVEVQAKTEVTIRSDLAKKPGRGDAITAYVFSGLFIGGGVYLGLTANGIKSELEDEIAAGLPPPDPGDSRFQKGKIFAIAADAAFGLGALSALTAIYYTFRDKGAPSSGSVDIKAVALEPQVGPGYAGLNMEMSW